MDAEQNEGQKRRSIVIALISVLLLVFGAWKFFASLSSQSPPPKKKIQKITLLAPPPPPPPKIEEKPPEPEVEEEVPEPEPEPEPVAEESESDEPPAGEDLGIDADGVAGSDGFGLVGKRGGRGLLSGGNARAWFINALKQDIVDILSENADTRRERFSVVIKLWLSDDGRLERTEIVKGSGDSDLDDAVQLALSGGHRLSGTPPRDMPQPLKIRIVSKI